MKKPDWLQIWTNCLGLRYSVIVMLLLLLTVIVSGCSSSPVVKVKYVKPEKMWLEPTPLYLDMRNLETYGQVRNQALGAALRAWGSCEADKKAIRSWLDKIE